jgi:PKD repeat protein
LGDPYGSKEVCEKRLFFSPFSDLNFYLNKHFKEKKMRTKMWRKLVTITVLSVFITGMFLPGQIGAAHTDFPSDLPRSSSIEKIDPVVLEQAAENGQADFFVWMVDKADLSQASKLATKLEKGQYVFDTLRATADRSQKDLRTFLDKERVNYRAFYIANTIFVYAGTQAQVINLAARDDVAKITANSQFQLQEPFIDPNPQEHIEGVESNISFVRAPEVWAMGVTGQGTVMAGNDTGLMWDHPALINQYRGWNGATVDHNHNWWDATGTYPMVPGDGHGHGTHTTGTMVGDDGGVNQIGLAPGAQTVHCKNMTDGGSGSDYTFLTCFEWDLAPWDLSGQNPQPSLAPDAINNSWGYWGGGQPQFIDATAALQAAGIVVEVSAGNEGSGCSSLRSPGDYAQVMTTGSVQHAGGVLPGTITPFSSRGPSFLDPFDFMPDIMAPGENIRSAVPGGGYQGGWSGTSMSGPHTTALVGLMWAANPALKGMVDQTYDIIHETAVRLVGQPGSSCGGDYVDGPNNDWGYGTMDALAAVQLAMAFGSPGTLQGTVTSSGGQPISGATITAEHEDGYIFSTTTDAAGNYSRLVMSGVYDVTASKYGWLPETVLGVIVVEDEVTTVNFFLDPAPSYTVSGVVTDANTGWPLYSSIAISGAPIDPVWTDPLTGEYSITLVAGSLYTFTVNAWVDGYLPMSRPVGPLEEDTIEDFELEVNVASCIAPGYSPAYAFFENFESGYGAWTMTGLWNPESQSDACGGMVAPFPSPTNASYYGVDGVCNFDVGYTTGSLTLQNPVTVPAEGGAVSFWSYEQTECSGNCYFDKRYTEISPDNGANWYVIGEGNTEGVWHKRNLDVTPYAGQDLLLRFRFDSVDGAVNNYFGWMVDDIAVATGCEPQPGSLIVGNVSDGNTYNGLVGAVVSSDMGFTTTTKATPSDPDVEDGFYSLFGPLGVQTLTASKSGYEDAMVTLDVPMWETVQQDFVLGAGILVPEPDSFEVTVELGSTTTETLYLHNEGSSDAEFEILEVNGGFTPVGGPGKVSIPAFTGEISRSGEPDSTGRAPQVSRHPVPNAVPTGLLSGAPAFGIDAYPGQNLVHWPDIDFPGSWSIIAPIWDAFFAGDFINGNFDTLYVLDYYTNQLKTVDTTTGVITTIGASIPFGSESWSGMTGSVGGVMYASSTNISRSTLYTLDLDTGAATVVGQITGADCVIDLAITPGEEIYVVDICQDALYSVNPETGAGTYIGPIGFDANFAQGMDYEEESGTLYLAAYNSMAGGELRIADVNTGNTVLVGAFPGGAEVTAFGFATGGASDVPWLSVYPETGTVPAGDTQEVAVTFDATVVYQPGEYSARLMVKNDTPYGSFNIPVVMHATPPSDYGKLEGTVTGLGPCDVTPAPLKEALVVIEGASMTIEVLTDADGYFQLWLPESESPLTITVTKDAHEVGFEDGVIIIGGEVTTVDFDLRWLGPCLSIEPDSLDVTLAYGETTSRTVTLTNTGAGEANFRVLERDLGYQPPLAKVEGHGEWLYRSETGVLLENNRGEAALAYPKAYRWTSSQPSDLSILIYADDAYHWAPNTYLDQALQALGFSYTAHYDGDYWGFEASLTSGSWDIVLFGNDNWGPPDSVFNALQNYVNDGGKLILNTWMISWYPSNPLWTTLGFTWFGDDYDPPNPVYWWSPDHPVFISPQSVPEFTLLQGGRYGTYGQMVEPMAGFEALAGYTTPGPDPNQAALVLGNDGRTVFKGFLDGQNDADLDSDGIKDGVELWINLIDGISTGFASDVPWLSTVPEEGVVLPGSSFDVEVVFDAGEVEDPGYHYALLTFKNNDPLNPNLGIPVSMLVTPPEGLGLLNGTVESLGYCDENPMPLKDAVVEIESSTGDTWTATTNSEGFFYKWLFEEGSPYTLSVTHSDHEGAFADGVIIIGDGTTTLEFSLRWLMPCISIDPELFNVEVPVGYSVSWPMNVVNDGALESWFEVIEMGEPIVTAAQPAPARTAPVPSGDPVAVAGSSRNGTLAQPYESSIQDDSILVLSTTDLYMSVERALWELGYTYDYIWAEDWTWIDYSPYDVVIIGMDGGYVLENSVQKIRTDVLDQGKRVIFVGGTCVQQFAYGVNDYLVSNLVYDYCWDIPFPPHFTVTDPSHPLAEGLPGTYDFIREYAAYYQLRINDPEAEVVAVNGHGWGGLFYKPVSDGDLFWFINSPYAWYWEYQQDFDLLKQVIENALNYQAFGDIPWLEVDPVAGTAPADSWIEVELTFTALPEMSVGETFTASLRIKTGDPAFSKVDIPLSMTIVEALPPEASFTFSPDVIFIGDVVSFINETSGVGPFTYLWDFGDGNTSTEEHPQHAFTAAGLFPVTLTATNAVGTHEFTLNVLVNEPIPESDLSVVITISPLPIYVEVPTTFTAVVSNAGPDDAEGVYIEGVMPASIEFISGANCALDEGILSCDLGTIAAGTSKTAVVVLKFLQVGAFEFDLSVYLDGNDPDPTNNSGTVQADVLDEPVQNIFLPFIRRQ